MSRIIVPFPAGGGTDVVARLVSDKMRPHFPQGLVVDNKPGASGRLGASLVGTSPPDGSTLLLVPDFVLTIVPHIFKKLAYDPIRDFAPIGTCSTTAYALSAGPGLPAHVADFASFVSWCKANPTKAAFASTSPGAASHFIGLMLSKAIGLALLHVPYKGGALALQDLLAGQIPVSINTLGEVLSQVKGGRVRVLATTGARRSRFLPDAPTLTECGVPDMEIETWVGMLAPRRTPPRTVDEISSWLDKALQGPDLQKALADTAMEPARSSPTEFASTIRKDLERWRPVVESSGFTAEE